jgi:hypothetical protein
MRAPAPHALWERMRRTPRPTRARPALRARRTPTLTRRRSVLRARLGRMQRPIRRVHVYCALQGSLHQQLAAPALLCAKPVQSASTLPADPVGAAFALRARPTPTPMHRHHAWRATAAHTLAAAQQFARYARRDRWITTLMRRHLANNARLAGFGTTASSAAVSAPHVRLDGQIWTLCQRQAASFAVLASTLQLVRPLAPCVQTPASSMTIRIQPLHAWPPTWQRAPRCALSVMKTVTAIPFPRARSAQRVSIHQEGCSLAASQRVP